MKVAKCCESKEPELLTFEQIKEREGVYRDYEDADMKYLVFSPNGSRDHFAILVFVKQYLWSSDGGDDYGDGRPRYIRTSETLCVGLKDAAGKWVE